MVKRSTINMNFTNIFDYMFINHVKQGDAWGPVGAAFATTTDPWNKNLDANGYPAHSNYDNHIFGLGIRVPASTNFAGPYVLTWDGNGEVFLNNGTWAIDAGQSSNYTAVNSARWHGTNSRIVLNYTGSRLLFSIQVLRTNRDGSGNFLKNLRFYRLEDEARLQAGKVFRVGALQQLADLNPGAIRFMNWTGHNVCQSVRFEHRTLPNYASYGGTANWVASPPYPESTGTNAIAVASATGMPVAMQHGEVVTCRMGNAPVRVGAKTISAITRANPGVVTATAHGFQTGDVIVHSISSGMTQLDNVPCTITLDGVDPTNKYSIGIDTSAFTAFSSGATTKVANQYITLDVGLRGPYPVVFGDGVTHATNYGTGYISQYDYKTFVFDKDLVASTAVTGAWTFNSNGTSRASDNVPPLEICTALINELMELTRTDGGVVGPIDMWITIPHRGMLSVDSDYSAASNWAKGAIDVIYNGANGFAGLNSQCDLIVEFSNETWNSAGGGGFDSYPFLLRKSVLRWGTTDVHSYTALRAAIMVNDIKASFPRASYPRIKYVMCGQGTLGVASGNAIRISGSALYDGDAWNTWGGDPMDHFDYFGVASYFECSTAYKSTNLASQVAAWVAASGAVAKEAACAAYVAGLKTNGGNETIDRYGTTLLTAYTAEMASRGKKYVMYEGGWNDATASGQSGWTLYADTDANQSNYLIAVKQSAAWAQAIRNFFDLYDANATALYPADYILIEPRWGHTQSDAYSSGVEGAGLDLAYTYMSLRNRGLSRLRAKN